MAGTAPKANGLTWPVGFWVGAFLVHLCLVRTHYATGIGGSFYHRCRSPAVVQSGNFSLLQDLQLNTQCAKCERNATDVHLSGYDDDEYYDTDGLIHVAFMVSSSRSLERVLILTAGLLSVDIRVTLLWENAQLSQSTIRAALSQHIPCDQEKAFRSMLLFDYIPLSGDVGCEDDIPCHILTSHQVLLSLVDHSDIWAYADAAVVDATFLPAVIATEAHLLPTLYLWENPSVYKSLVTNTASKSPVALLRERWKALEFPFAALNHARSQMLGLSRVRTLKDIWHAGILWVPLDQELPGAEDVLTLLGPFLPPCFPCDYELQQQSRTIPGPLPSVVVSATFRNDLEGQKSLRTVLRALAVARSSLRTCSSIVPDDTTYDEVLPCWNFTEPFRIVLLGPEPDVQLTDYMIHSSTGLLDALAVFAPTVALLARCQDNPGTSGASLLGPPVVCVDQPHIWNAPNVVEALAAHLLRVLTRPPPMDPTTNYTTPNDDALFQLIRVLQTMAVIKSEFGSSWTNGWDVKRDLVKYLFASRSSGTRPAKSVSSRFVLHLACLVVVCAGLYLLWSDKDATRSPMRFFPHWQRQQHPDSLPGVSVLVAAFGELWLQLPELDRAWILWTTWMRDVWRQMQEPSDEEDPIHPSSNGPRPAAGNTNGVLVEPRKPLVVRSKRRSTKSKRH